VEGGDGMTSRWNFYTGGGLRMKRVRGREDEEANDPDDLKGMLPDFFLHQILTN
jgi:hypothetical protein